MPALERTQEWRGPPRTALNHTKLRPPSRKRGLIERPALMQRLQGQTLPRLALIQAPAGFGKTSLLSQLFHATRENDRAAWLSLDCIDNDCTRFVQHLIAALETLGIELDGRLTESARLPLAATCDLLSNALADLSCDVVFCVDDFHVITDATIERLLSSLLLCPSSRLSWVIATRVTPAGLPLSRLRLLGELVEMGASDLEFSAAEAGELFAGVAGLSLPPPLIELAHARTEGWVAGLQMAAFGLAAADDPAAVLGRFSGMNRNVAEFLQSEVLGRLGEETVRFLLDTSVLPRMCTPLCNHVTQSHDARARLDELEALNLFIFSLDDERGWYRYHQLFAGFLEQRLRDQEPERARRLHERASQWLEDNGHGIEAVEHALKAHAFVRAARLLERLELYEQGQADLQERLAERIPQGVLEQFPNLQLERNWGWQSGWEFAKCRLALGRLRRLLREWRSGARAVPADVDLDYVAAKLAHRELMVAFVSDDMKATRRLCEHWLAAGHPSDRHMEVSTRGALMAARREHYCCEDTALTAAALHEVYQQARFSFGEIFQDCITGTTFLMQAEVLAARQVYERALKGAITLHGRVSLLASMPGLLLAELHYERGELAEARALVADYLPLAHGLGYVDKLIAGFLTKSRLELLDGRSDSAQRTLDDAQRYADTTGFARLRAHVLAERLRQLLLLGRTGEAVEIARRAGLLSSSLGHQPHGAVTTQDEILALAWSRASEARGELDAPIRLLKNWYEHALERHCGRSALRLAVELARLLHARQDRSAACHHLCQALRLAQPGGLTQVFLDGGGEIRDVLAATLAGTVLTDAERRLAQGILGSFGELRLAVPRDAPPEPGQPADLNRRERDILELAAGDVPNREIARRLALSENTVKWYWKRIFAKLAVSRRLQAVNSARAAGVIF
jgi:LuxR family transcriptional regulator, maltose regulon positive regulatory protein